MLWYPILVGLIQGLTEFLPISSSGHLVVFQSLLGKRVDSLTLNIATHLGTLGAILIYYRGDLLQLIQGFMKKKEESTQMIRHILMACVPTALVGLFIKTQMEWILINIWVSAFGFLITSLILSLASKAFSRRNSFSIKAFGIDYRSAFFIGLAQSLALIPGVSRSGSTIVTGLYMGMSPRDSSRFSFLIAIPAILGAFLLELSNSNPDSIDYQSLSIAMGVSFFMGLGAISWTVHLVQSNKIRHFAPYTLLLFASLALYQLAQLFFKY